MKKFEISKIESVKPSNNGNNFHVVVLTDSAKKVSLIIPCELELDLMLPLQIASNEAAGKRGPKSICCHRAMRPSRMGLISDANGITVLQFVFSDRNKLDVIVPLSALTKIKENAIEFLAMQSSKAPGFIN